MIISSVEHHDGYLEIVEDGNFFRREVKWEDTVVSAIESSGQYKVVNLRYRTSDGHLIVIYTDGTTQSELDIDPTAIAGGIASVVEDTTPQLGGDLDLNGKNIDFPTTPNISDCLDEDNMASNSATKLATQQSIKAYVDAGGQAPAAHKASHQDTGTDEINVEGLAGLLADDQHVLDTEVLAVAAALSHGTEHQNGEADEIDVTGLSGLLADDQHVLDAEVVVAAKTVKLDDFTAPDDTTDLDASAAKHGLMPKVDKSKLDGIAASAIANVVEDTTPQLGGNLELNSKNIEVPVEPGTNETSSAFIWKGATVDTNAEGIGAPLFLAADGHFDTADADGSTTAPCVALALEEGTGTKDVLLFGVMRHDDWDWTTGPGKASLIYVSCTVGALTQTKPTGTDDVIQPVGYALTDDVMFFNPSMMYYTHT